MAVTMDWLSREKMTRSWRWGIPLILGMIVRDPHQAHRPPDQRTPGVVVMVDPRTA